MVDASIVILGKTRVAEFYSFCKQQINLQHRSLVTWHNGLNVGEGNKSKDDERKRLRTPSDIKR